MSHLNCSGRMGRSYHLDWRRHKYLPVTWAALSHAAKYKRSCFNFKGQTGSVSYSLLGKILKEIFLITLNQYFGEEFHTASVTSDFSEVKRTTLTSQLRVWHPLAAWSSHLNPFLVPHTYRTDSHQLPWHIHHAGKNVGKAWPYIHRRKWAYHTWGWDTVQRHLERRGLRWDTQSNQNYSSHGWALRNLLSHLGHTTLWMCQFRPAGPAQTAP